MTAFVCTLDVVASCAHQCTDRAQPTGSRAHTPPFVLSSTREHKAKEEDPYSRITNYDPLTYGTAASDSEHTNHHDQKRPESHLEALLVVDKL